MVRVLVCLLTLAGCVEPVLRPELDGGHDEADGADTPPDELDGGHRSELDAGPSDAGKTGLDAGPSDAGKTGLDAASRDAGPDAPDPDGPDMDAGDGAVPAMDAATRDGSTEDAACTCPDGAAVCETDSGTCENFCAVPVLLPGELADEQPPHIACVSLGNEPEPSFAQLCTRRCEARCLRRAWFCPGAACAPDECDSPAVQEACASECSTGSERDRTRCIQRGCGSAAIAGCEDTVCPGGEPAVCADDLHCSEDCGTYRDGYCDDGDTFGTDPVPGAITDTDSDYCTWGTDCADCGPRRGFAPMDLPLGAQCRYHKSCAGNVEVVVDGLRVSDLATNGAFCAEIADVRPGNFRCLLDASGPGETCPEGFRMEILTGPDRDNSGAPDPIEQDGLVAKVCLPICNVD